MHAFVSRNTLSASKRCCWAFLAWSFSTHFSKKELTAAFFLTKMKQLLLTIVLFKIQRGKSGICISYDEKQSCTDIWICLMVFAGQSFRYVLVIYPSLVDQAGGESHREHGWQAGGYMNSSFFTGGEKAQLTKDKKWTVNTLNKAQQTYRNKSYLSCSLSLWPPLLFDQPPSSPLLTHSLFHFPHKRKAQNLQSAN